MLDWLMSTPVLVKVLASLALILVVNRVAKNLVVAAMAGTAGLAVWSGHGPGAIASIAWQRAAGLDNLLLMAVIVGVIALSRQMAEAGVMRDLVAAVRSRTGRRASMAVLPALIGLLPMPGGAIFSAPLVDSCDAEGRIRPGLKAKTNYWFRHIWEYWWPLYPGVLLAMALTGLEVWQWAALMAPMTAVAVGVGWLHFLRKIDPGTAESAGPEAPGAGRARWAPLVAPIVVVVAGYAAVKLGWAGLARAWPEVPALNKYVPMLVGLLAAMILLQVQRPVARHAWRRILLSPKTLSLVLIVATVRVYGAFIEADLPGGTPLVEAMSGEMNARGIPPHAMMMVIPFVSGLVTGLAVGMVGASFPIVINLLGPDPSMPALLSSAALAYGFGYMGMMLSPVHVCLIVTSEHFGTRLAANLKRLAAPAATLLAAVLLYHFLVSRVVAVFCE